MFQPGINNVVLFGRVGDDPTTVATPSGNSYCRISVATFAGSRVTGQDGQGKDVWEENPPDWQRVVAWNKDADTIARNIRKGANIGVIGRIKPRSWKDKDGNKHYETNVVVDTVFFMEKREVRSQEQSRSYGNRNEGGIQAPDQQGMRSPSREAIERNPPPNMDEIPVPEFNPEDVAG